MEAQLYKLIKLLNCTFTMNEFYATKLYCSKVEKMGTAIESYYKGLGTR